MNERGTNRHERNHPFGKCREEAGPLNLSIEPGYIVAIVGPNGSGKSTLFRMLMNLVKPERGTLRLLGEQYPEAETGIKQRIGFVPEVTEWEDMASTVGELTQFISMWYPSWNERKYRELLARFKLDEGLQLKKLSTGMQSKLAFIYAIAQEPGLLLLDEPTSGLVPLAWRDMLVEIVRFMDNGQGSVLIATHILEEVRRFADYIVFLYDGQLLGRYEKDTLLEQWKSIWIERAPEGAERLPGVVRVELGPAAALELDEIFAYMIGRQSAVGYGAARRSRRCESCPPAICK